MAMMVASPEAAIPEAAIPEVAIPEVAIREVAIPEAAIPEDLEVQAARVVAAVGPPPVTIQTILLLLAVDSGAESGRGCLSWP